MLPAGYVLTALSFIPSAVCTLLAVLLVRLAGGSFVHPRLVYALPAAWLVLLALRLLGGFRKRRNLRRLGDPALLARTAPCVSAFRGLVKTQLFVQGVLLLMVTAARPQWGEKTILVAEKGVDLVVAVDTSRSMLSEDVKPNRLEAAKRELSDIIDQLRGDRIAIVAFAGRARLQCPLTLDYSAARLMLSALDPSLIPVPGTDIGRAVRAAASTFKPKTDQALPPVTVNGKQVVDVEQARLRILVLITDGEDHGGDAVKAARDAAADGVVIYTLGIGTGEGVPIPDENEQGERAGYKKDREGKVVLSRLDEATLREMAEVSGGKYFRGLAGEGEMKKILEAVDDKQKQKFQERREILRDDRFQLFLAAALICLLLENLIPEAGSLFRRARVPNGASGVNGRQGAGSTGGTHAKS